MAKILGISGSSVTNSATDGLLKMVMEASGMDWEFIKLVDCKIAPCKCCTVQHPDYGFIVPCQIDNECIIHDDYKMISDKMREADAIVLGTNATFFHINGQTKIFMDRTIALSHGTVTKDPPAPLAGKLGANVVLCNSIKDGQTVAQYADMWANEMMFRSIGSIVIQGSWGCQASYQCCLSKRYFGIAYSPVQATTRVSPPTPPWNERRCAVREPLQDPVVLEEARNLGLKIEESYRMATVAQYPMYTVPPGGIKLEAGGDRYGNTPQGTTGKGHK